jgi:hydroxyethylthiazole kinase-like uncharacterized protein yjeF
MIMPLPPRTSSDHNPAMKILPPKSIQDWEQKTIDGGTTVEALMEEAVDGLMDYIRSSFRHRRVLVMAGKGHNGDDSLWLGLLLKKAGKEVEVVLSHPPEERHPPAQSPIPEYASRASVWPDYPPDLFSGDPLLIIDGLLGLGASGNPREPVSPMIEWVQSGRRACDHLLSVDVPSGLDAANGTAGSPCIQADTTLCLAAIKTGLLPDEAAPYVGRLHAVPISLQAPGPDTTMRYFDRHEAREVIRPLPADSHKHSRGSVAIWAGSPGMAGAAILASRSALRSGAGLVRCFCHPEIYSLIATATPEVMVTPHQPSEPWPSEALESGALLAGPGIGINPQSQEALGRLISGYSGPLVIDADALRIIARNPGWRTSLPPKTILTPHPGEFRELAPDAPRDRMQAALEWAASAETALLVLKGQRTLIASKEEGLTVNGSGNPGMATAGMGDVLAGIITGLAASGYTPYNAARLGCFWHGAAADQVARSRGEPSLTAGDVISSLGETWKWIKEGA